jgi:hypothetical protein
LKNRRVAIKEKWKQYQNNLKKRVFLYVWFVRREYKERDVKLAHLNVVKHIRKHIGKHIGKHI